MARVLILFNQPLLPVDHPDYDSEVEVEHTVENVERVLKAAGHDVSLLGVRRDPDVLIAGIRDAQPDVVFNLFEGYPDWGETDGYCVGLLEWLGVPYTGCTPEITTIARNKPLTKQVLRGAGLPTADFIVVNQLPVPEWSLGWPAFVKPATQDASVGVGQASVVSTQAELEARVAWLLDQYGPPVLVEEYIPGREFWVGVIQKPEVVTLPIAELRFNQQVDPNQWPIVTYKGKWDPDSPEFASAHYPALKVSKPLRAKLAKLTTEAFYLLGGRDYMRVDFRVKPNGKPYILEVNPNPDLSPEAGLCRGMELVGITWEEFVVQMVENARGRVRRQPGAFV